MTASEIMMKRDDPNIAWGFRLTGGADLGTAFFVVKVLGRGHAERAGLRVGDMVYAINHEYISNCSHKEVQNAILHTGDTLFLNIKRGPFSGRGTPLPEYEDPLMGIAPPPETKRPKPVPLPPYQPPPPVVREPSPESEEEVEVEETVAAFNVKINPKGRIAAIEELPVTPPPSRASSRCRSRSRSASRDRRSSSKRGSTTSQQQGVKSGSSAGISGPGEAFTYSKEVVTQFSTVLSSSNQTGGQTSELINESFVIHGGSSHKMEDILSPEDIERDIFEEKMEEQRITELLTGETEVLDQGVLGINFQKIIPKTDFIKESNVFKELQDQRIKKEESEEEQLKKDPNKRFSTFLQTPKRPIPILKTKPQSTEDAPWKQHIVSPFPEIPQLPLQQFTQLTQSVHEEDTFESTKNWTESVNIIEEIIVQETHADQQYNPDMLGVPDGGGPVITEAVSTEHIYDEKVHFQDENIDSREDRCSIEEFKEQQNVETQKHDAETPFQKPQENCTPEEPKSEFERQLADIQKQIQSIQQLPNLLQANLTSIQEQLAKIVEAKTSADQQELEKEVLRDRGGSHSSLQWKIDVTVEETKEEPVNGDLVEQIEVFTEQDTEMQYCQTQFEDSEVTMENDDFDLSRSNIEQLKNMENQQYLKRDDDEMSVTKPSIIRHFPRQVAERPIVLPGGRKWYTPRDAYNEDFIAETIIHQSEVLIGTTIGLNFQKYEPPKFDAANSSVLRLIKEMENRCNGGTGLPIEERPEKVLAEEDYFPAISKRHFFAARLAEQSNENVEKILEDTNGQAVVSV